MLAPENTHNLTSLTLYYHAERKSVKEKQEKEAGGFIAGRKGWDRMKENKDLREMATLLQRQVQSALNSLETEKCLARKMSRD